MTIPVATNLWAQDDDDLSMFDDDETGDDAGDEEAFNDDESGGSEVAAEPDVREEESMVAYKAKDDSKDPKDPFKPTVEPPMRSVRSKTKQTKRRQRKVEVPPLPIRVKFIVGSETNRMALIDLNGKSYEMRAGDSEEGGLFKVLEVSEKGIKVFDTRIQRNRVIKLSGN
jgi:hypothetical protein